MKKSTLTLLVILVSLFGLNAQTDTIPEDMFDMTLEELMNIKVSGVSRYKQSAADVPNSIQVITHQQIVDRGYHDLSDLLKDVQGMDVTANAGQFGEFYSMRGISGNDRFLVLINGHKLNPATGTQISIGNSVSIAFAERVEIIYGPASAVYGADAFSGIINIIFNENNGEKKESGVSAELGYGSLNTIDAAIEADVVLSKDLSLYAMARFYASDGPDFTEVDPQYEVVNDYPSPLVPSFEQPTNDHTVFVSLKYKKFSLNYYRQQFDEGNALGFVPSIYIYNKENKWKTSTDIIWANYVKTFSNQGALTFDVMYKNHVQDNNTIYYKWNIPGVFDAAQTYKQYMTGDDKTINAVLSYNLKMSEKLSFIAGIDNEFTHSIPPYGNDEVLGQSDQYTGANATLIQDELTIQENRLSGFGQFVYSPVKILSFVLGARYDYSTRYEGTFNPRAGFILSPTSTTKLKFIYGKAFQAPSLFYQYEQWGAPTIVNLSSSEVAQLEPGWQLENQIVNSFEFSVTQKLGTNTNLIVTGYYNSLSNLIERNMFSDSVYNKYFDVYTPGLRNENIGSQSIIGGDFSYYAKLGKKVIAYANYSYTDAVSETGDRESSIPRISKHKMWIGFSANDLFGYLTVSPRFKWVGAMSNLNSTAFPDNQQDGFYTVDLSLSVHNLSKYFRLFANFENLLNQEYELGGLYEQAGVYTAIIPQEGFAFKAGIEVFVNRK